MYSALTVPGSFRMKGVLAGRETHLIVLLTSVVFLTAWAICIQIFPPTDDVVNFFNNAELMKSCLLPYKDFVFEFPPLSLPLFLIPSIFTSDLTVYTWLFGLEVVISAVVVQYFLMRMCEVVGLNRGLVALMFGALVILYFSESLKKFPPLKVASCTHEQKQLKIAFADAKVFSAPFPNPCRRTEESECHLPYPVV